MGDEQRTFIPDDDSAERADWPKSRPRPKPQKPPREPLSYWLPGVIVVVCGVVVVLVELLF